MSAKLNGDDEQIVMAPSVHNAGLSDVALDIAGGKVNVTEEGADAVRRPNLDGSNLEPPLQSGTVVDGAEAIALYVCAP